MVLRVVKWRLLILISKQNLLSILQYIQVADLLIYCVTSLYRNIMEGFLWQRVCCGVYNIPFGNLGVVASGIINACLWYINI